MDERSLRAFLGGRLPASQYDVLGIRVGSAAGDVRGVASLVTSVEGTRPEPVGSSRLDRAIETGGWVRTAVAAFHVADGRVSKISIAGHVVGHMRTDADLSAMMGVPDARLASSGRVQFHYEARQIDVFFELAPFRIMNVLLGGVGDRSQSDPAPTFNFDGRLPARLAEIRMNLVYSGLLVGVPTREMNARIVEDAVKDAQAKSPGVPVFLVVPAEKPIDLRRPYSFGSPARLPAVACVGRFRSRFVARDERSDGSDLTVVWFQNQMEMPAENAFVGVPWRTVAIDSADD